MLNNIGIYYFLNMGENVKNILKNKFKINK